MGLEYYRVIQNSCTTHASHTLLAPSHDGLYNVEGPQKSLLTKFQVPTSICTKFPGVISGACSAELLNHPVWDSMIF